MPGPLDGIRVLDFTIAQQGPYATLLLADMGAEVIKVEGRERGEVGRLLGIDRRTGFSAYFLAINRGKKSITARPQEREGTRGRAPPGARLRYRRAQLPTRRHGEARPRL